MAWTESEAHAIQDGQQAATRRGVVPSGLAPKPRRAWIEGYARGWAAVGSPGTIDAAECRPSAADWRAGWNAGIKVARDVARGWKIEPDAEIDAAYAFIRTDRELWSQMQRDAYDDGYASGLAGLIPVPKKRYQGHYRVVCPIWGVGYMNGLREMMRRDMAASGRHRVTAVPPVAELIPPAPAPSLMAPLPVPASLPLPAEGTTPPAPAASPLAPPPVPKLPATGSERQQSYRARRGSKSLDISNDTYEYLLRLRNMQDFDSIDDALQFALRVALGE